MIKLKTIRIKYLRNRSTTFWSEREVGQVREETAFEGMIDEVLEIEGISDTTKKSQYVCKNCGKEYPFNKVNMFHIPPRCPYCLSTCIEYVGPGLEPPEQPSASLWLMTECTHMPGFKNISLEYTGSTYVPGRLTFEEEK